MRGRVGNKALPKLEKDLEFEVKSNKEYEIELIINTMVYGQWKNNNQMPSFYYLVL